MNWVSLSVQTLPVLSSETFEVWVTTDMCPAVISLHFPSNTLHVFLQYQQQQKNIFDNILEGSTGRVTLFSEGLHCCIGNYNNHLPPKKTVTHSAPANSYCYSSEHSTLMGHARSELQKGGSSLAAHKEGLSSTRGQSQAKNPKQESQQNKNAFLLSRGQPMADFSHVYHISAIKQASLWDKGLTRRRKIAIVLEIIYYVLIK